MILGTLQLNSAHAIIFLKEKEENKQKKRREENI